VQLKHGRIIKTQEIYMTLYHTEVEAKYNDCPECDGTGVIVYASLNDDIPLRSCNNCSGKGYVEMDELDWLE
jgi:DnaJ-class molecular chaperone